MANQTLRQLAKEHAQGNLDKDSYRKTRAELLQGIVSGSVPLEEIDFPPPVRPPEPESQDTTERRDDRHTAAANAENENAAAPSAVPPEAAAPGPAASSTAQAGSESSSSGKGLLIGIALLVIVLVIAVSVFMMQGKKKEVLKTTPTAATANTSPVEAAPADAVSKAQQLIKDFLATNNWSTQSLDQFTSDWADLSNDEVTATGESVALGQLTNAIYRQLLEEQALSGLVDDDSSLNKQRQLVEFANTLGIDDSRIQLPEESGQ